MPYEEIQHTADWCLHVWAVDLSSLFSDAARGMNTLSGMQSAPRPVMFRTFEASAPDPESLLVSFLSELVFAAEQEKIGFDNFDIKIAGQKMRVEMKGAPLVSINRMIKAVTYHNLQIQQTMKGYEVEIVFDV